MDCVSVVKGPEMGRLLLSKIQDSARHDPEPPQTLALPRRVIIQSLHVAAIAPMHLDAAQVLASHMLELGFLILKQSWLDVPKGHKQVVEMHIVLNEGGELRHQTDNSVRYVVLQAELDYAAAVFGRRADQMQVQRHDPRVIGSGFDVLPGLVIEQAHLAPVISDRLIAAKTG